jgi:hypothetical protein
VGAGLGDAPSIGGVFLSMLCGSGGDSRQGASNVANSE